MTTDESLEQFGLVPSDEALPIIRKILAKEAAAERAGEDRVDDLALLCCVQLFSRGLLEDVLRIWKAKASGMDLGCVIDVQFLCGAGLQETKRYLGARAGKDAARALDYITRCEAASNFRDFTPEKHLAGYKRYFGVN